MVDSLALQLQRRRRRETVQSFLHQILVRSLQGVKCDVSGLSLVLLCNRRFSRHRW